MRCFRLFFETMLLALLSGSAFANTTSDELQRFGLTGQWASACEKAAGPGNSWVVYLQDGGDQVRRRLDRGAWANPLMTTVISARILTGATINLHIRNDDAGWGAMNGVVSDVIMVKENGRMRSLESTVSDGKQYIKAGMLIQSNQPTPWLERRRD